MPLPIILRWPASETPPGDLLKQLAPDMTIGDGPLPDPLKNTVTRGSWPGIRSSGKRGGGDDIASASREPWVDANGYLVAYERALRPDRPAILGQTFQEPERMVPFETLELALVEARVNGGNFILTPEPRYRGALIKGDPKALEAWRSLADTAAWLRANEAMFGRPANPSITALVEPGMPTSEISNLLFRRGASPSLVAAERVPPPAPDKILALVAAGLKSVPAAALAHAEAGATVIIDTPPDPSWKIVKQEKDRNFYAVGKGKVVSYLKRIADPSEFALDVIDVVTYRRRAARLWNALASIPLATAGPRAGEAYLHIINYGSPMQQEVQARILGRFTKATLFTPEAQASELKIYDRGTMTEIFLPKLRRLAVIHFS